MTIDLFVQLLGYFLTPITGLVGWFAAKRTRDNDTLNQLQATIDMLVEKNKELIIEITELRQENAELRAGQAELNAKLESLQKSKNE